VSHPAQNRSFWRRSSQAVCTEEAISNTTKANSHQQHEDTITRNKHTKKLKPFVTSSLEMDPQLTFMFAVSSRSLYAVARPWFTTFSLPGQFTPWSESASLEMEQVLFILTALEPTRGGVFCGQKDYVTDSTVWQHRPSVMAETSLWCFTLTCSMQLCKRVCDCIFCTGASGQRVLKVSEWMTWCQTCRHGGHAGHIQDWFRWAKVSDVLKCSSYGTVWRRC